jgi:hypothetical protein
VSFVSSQQGRTSRHGIGDSPDAVLKCYANRQFNRQSA